MGIGNNKKGVAGLVPELKVTKEITSLADLAHFFPPRRLSNPVTLHLRGLPSDADTPYPGTTQESQNRLRGLLVLQPPDREGLRMLPPVNLREDDV